MAEGFEFKPTTAEAAEFLRGIDFPADKNKVVQYARDHKAPDNLLQILDKMPEAQYTSMADVFQGFGQVQ